MRDVINLADYTHAPRLDIGSGVTLGLALLRLAMPASEAPPLLAKATDRLRTTTAALQKEWGTRHETLGSKRSATTKSADIRLDTVHRAISGALTSLGMLPESASPRVERARSLLKMLYPDGRKFLNSPYVVEYAESQKRLDLIDKNNLGPEIDALCGPEFLPELRAAHEEYGRAVLSTLAGETSVIPNELRPYMASLSDSIVNYAIQVVATVDPDDPTTVERVRAMLRPMEVLREQQARRGKNEEEEVNVPQQTPEPIKAEPVSS